MYSKAAQLSWGGLLGSGGGGFGGISCCQGDYQFRGIIKRCVMLGLPWTHSHLLGTEIRSVAGCP